MTIIVSLYKRTFQEDKSFLQVKRKGGWPKGRKRKPELEHRAPKAPATGYVLYLNEKRKLLEYKDMAFTEV